MLKKFKDVFLVLLKNGLNIDSSDCSIIEDMSEEDARWLYRFSNSQDFAHIIAAALWRGGALERFPELCEKFLRKWNLAHYRNARIESVYNRVCELLSLEKIDFLPLKGIVSKDLYPESWMRTSCDMDILVRKEDMERASCLLIDKLNFAKGEEGTHDLQLIYSGDTVLELHYSLIEERYGKKSSYVLNDVWSNIIPTDSCKKSMTPEMFYFYHVAHMAKHFIMGGCGVRPFVDLYFMRNKDSELLSKSRDILCEAGLYKFAQACEKIVDAWFCEGESGEELRDVETYVISGGIYGTMKNYSMVHAARAGGKYRFYLSRIWAPYDDLVYTYPALREKRWLVPVYQIKRWFRLVFRGGIKKSTKARGFNADTKEQEKKMIAMLQNLELN